MTSRNLIRTFATVYLAFSTATAAVTSFTLVNADSNADIQTIANGDTINLATLPTGNLNIRANVDVAPTNVAMVLSGATSHSQTEGIAPYALWGDNSGNYDPGSLNVGAHTLSGTPSGGSTYTVNFTVINNLTGQPTASAGTDKTVTLPTNSTTLTGSGSDDGSITSYSWTQQSGPNTATLSGQNSATLSASGLVAGSYVMRLTVTDNDGNTASDEASIEVIDNTIPPAQGVYLEEDGLVIMEMESTESALGLWEEQSALSGYTGSGYLQFLGNSYVSGPPNSPLEFSFTINQSGRYYLHIHCAKQIVDGRTDVANDAYVRVEGDYTAGPGPYDSHGDNASLDLLQNDTKYFGGNANAWKWEDGANNLDPGGHTNKRNAVYDFKAGETYKLVVSGRSKFFRINRIMFRHTSVGKNSAQDLSRPESERSSGTTEKSIAYIYGDVAEDGTTPSGAAAPYDQMLLTDTGSTGCSIFKTMVEAEGYSISQHYDAETTLDASFLNQFDVVIFGLHQKIWTSAEKSALDTWLQAGGGALFYSDSAAGGKYNVVGAQNPVGQTAVNNVIAAYGMQVLVDQAAGVTAYRAGPEATHPIVTDRPVFEGEGVSPVAVDPASSVQVLIPYVNDATYKVSGNSAINHTQNMTISNPTYAAMATVDVGDGKLMAMFDRQPMWNDGPGSDIEKQDNLTILRRVVAYLAGDLTGPPVVLGELKKWHKVTLQFEGPNTSETATPNPFTDYRLDVTFTNGSTTYVVPGYYAADGDAANTGSTSGNIWLVHFAPDEIGTWTWSASFTTGANVAQNGGGSSGGFMDGMTGSFEISPTDKTGRDFRGKGRLDYVGKHHLQFAETGEYFMKQGPDAPENFLNYVDFDGTPSNSRRKTWSAHASDWKAGDPTWAGGKGTEIIGAINYLASEGLNVFSFLTMNIGGDDNNAFPYVLIDTQVGSRPDTSKNGYQNVRETVMDVSKLAQWGIVFDHATQKGLYLHFKTQETENDHMLDGGDLGLERKLYYRELIARFGHNLALNWNLGEENVNTNAQRISFAQFFYDNDPYRHNVVIHSYPNEDNLVYGPMLGSNSKLTGTSLQLSNSSFTDVFGRVKEWVDKSATAGKPWVVAVDEPGDPSAALRPANNKGNSWEDARKNALWGTIMAGGAGCEWYFGYNYIHSDLSCEDFRSRDGFWDYCRYAITFLQNNNVPFQDMSNSSRSSNSASWCLDKEGEVYLVYLKNGGTTNLDLSGVTGTYSVKWFDPRNGGNLQNGSVTSITGGSSQSLGNPPSDTSSDWAVLVRRDTGDLYNLNINNGSGSGTYYDGNMVAISADTPPAGQIFDAWTGDTSYVADINQPTTSVTMPAQDVTLTATYKTAVFYTLTVNGGSGDGSYVEGAEVVITADAPPTGQVFDAWTGDTAGITNVNNSSTTLTMPASTATVTATYQEAPDVLIGVNAGGGAFTAADGTVYVADQYSSGGSAYTSTDSISNTEDDALYQSERWGTFTYSVPVPNGSYDVRLQFAEIYSESNGSRVFDLLIEGVVVVDDLDIHAVVGHDAAHDLQVNGVDVSDGFLTLTFTASADNPKISAFRIETAGSGMVDTDEDGMDDAWETTQFGNLTTATLTSDWDGDGASDLHEYESHTDPKDNNAYFGIVTLTPVAGTNTINLEWKGSSLASYTVETNDDLSTGWDTYATGLSGSDLNALTVTMSGTSFFIRVVQE